MSLAPGIRVGAFEIVSLIGSGGMGEVYRARDPRLGRDVAIKVLPSAFSDDPGRLARFEQEARAAAALNHPNILAVFDIGSHAAAPYIVSELLEGETLHERLSGAALPIKRALDFAIQIARGLAAAHDKGIVHRDLKPGNIFITADGRVKILDFGLAKLIENNAVLSGLSALETKALEGARPELGKGAPPAAPLTGPGVVLGTIGYMAPEQVRGLTADHRADIFSFGAILYEMLAGQRAFSGDTVADTMTAILKEDPPDLPAAERHIPPSLSRIVDRCLEKNPAARFKSADDLAFALETPSATSGETSAIAGAGAPPTSKARARLAWVTSAAFAAVAIAALGLAAMLYVRAPDDDAVAMRFLVSPPDGWTLVTTPAGIASAPLAISPDGRRLAMVAEQPGRRPIIWIRTLDSLIPQPLAGTDDASNPFWSPDSRSLAFFARGKLKKIDIAGGPPVELCDGATGGSGTWNPDGVIVFTPGPGSALQKVSAAGGVPTPLTTLAVDDETAHTRATFLPDGRHFLYHVRTDVAARLPDTAGTAVSRFGTVPGGVSSAAGPVVVGSLDSTERTPLLNIGSSNILYSQGHLIYLRDTTLMAHPFDAERRVLTGEAVPIAEQVRTVGSYGMGVFSVSATGVLVYQTGSPVSGTQLLWLDPSGKVLSTVGERAPYGDLALSRDERRAAVSVLDAAKQTRDLWIVDLARGTRTRATFDPADDAQVIWSPDGGRLVFSSARKGRYDLYVKPSSGVGSEQVLLADAFDKAALSWSADGQFVLYARSTPREPPDLWVLPMSGDRKPFPFVQSPFVERGAEFSPDGRWIAYTSNESGRVEIYVAPFPKADGKWQASRGEGGQPRWSRNGKALFYVPPDGRLMKVAVDGRGAAFEVADVEALFPVRPGGPRSFYEVAVDGRFLVNAPPMEELTAAAPVTVVINWTAALKR